MGAAGNSGSGAQYAGGAYLDYTTYASIDNTTERKPGPLDDIADGISSPKHMPRAIGDAEVSIQMGPKYNESDEPVPTTPLPNMIKYPELKRLVNEIASNKVELGCMIDSLVSVTDSQIDLALINNIQSLLHKMVNRSEGITYEMIAIKRNAL